MNCMNTSMMGQRQADDDHAERLADAIEARGRELLQHGEACDPMDSHNVIEAMEAATDTDKQLLGKWLASEDYEACGFWLAAISKEYWSKMADELAEKELT
jgi:hypothetical protein